MPYEGFHGFATNTGTSFQDGGITLPAGTTILSAHLEVFTSFQSGGFASGTVDTWAPPNTLLGISINAGGTAPTLPTFDNAGDPEWLIWGMGVLTACDTYLWDDTSTAVPGAIAQTYAQTMDLSHPVVLSAAGSMGFSGQWMGAGFWPNNQGYLFWRWFYEYQ